MRSWENLRKSEIKNILVIRFWSVAEILSATPLVRVLRNCFPDAKIDFLLKEKFSHLLAGCPFVDEVIPCYDTDQKQGIRETFCLYRKVKRYRYDLIIDLQGDSQSSFLTFLSRAKLRIGYHLPGWKGKVYTVRAEELPVKRHLVLSYLDLVKDLFDCGGNPLDLKLFVAKADDTQKEMNVHDFGDENKKKLLIYQGVNRLANSWPVDKFAQLAECLVQQYKVEIILAGSDTDLDRQRIERINKLIKGKGHVFYHSTLSQLISLMKNVDIFIGHDNGPMHIAAALGKHVVGLFGPSDPRVRHPWGSGHEVLWPRVPCSPCNYRECPKDKPDCMDKIEVSGVLEAVHRFLV